MELDDTICYCFHVRKRKIINFLRIHQPRRASQLSECGGAGTGCGWCIAYLKQYFAEATQGEAADDSISADDYAKGRGQYLKEGKGTAPPGALPSPSE